MSFISEESEATPVMKPDVSGCILMSLRASMRNMKLVSQPLQAYIVPNNDVHLSEYLADCDKRLEYISAFTGSAGTAIITEDDALLWTDGRYHIQAAEEIDLNWTLMKAGLPDTPTEAQWINNNLEKGARVGVDPKVVPFTVYQNLKRELEQYGNVLVPVGTNLVDTIWEERPDPPENNVLPHPIEFTGRTSKAKVEEVREKMNEKGAEILIVTALDDIAWLLNLRGSDIPFNPVFFSYLIVMHHQIHLFIAEHKITLAVRNHFNKEDLPISLHSYDNIYGFVSAQANAPTITRKIWVCSPSNYEIFSLVPEKHRIAECSPITLLKAIKNETEAKGMINAHIKDAVALCRYFAWLEKEVPSGKVSEMSGSKQLDDFRKEEDGFIGPSFATISSTGANGAKNHYRPSPESDRLINCEELYLCDSGAQFRDGTTDVTRTVHFGNPTEFEKQCFTRVFQGQTALGTAIFPNKIKGNCLDVIARRNLWDVGLDYLHSTGHGIGAYLHVHEGPMGIGNRPWPDDPGLQRNMFLSNEPGFYQEGEFGIRLENIVQIVSASTPHNFKDKGFLTFNTVTLVPIQTKMLIPSALTKYEIQYLNDYHNKCREVVGPILKKSGHQDAYEWLLRETEPIG